MLKSSDTTNTDYFIYNKQILLSIARKNKQKSGEINGLKMELQDLKPQNLQSYCRTCLAKCSELKHDVEALPNSILQIFKTCTGYKKKQKSLYPNSICDQCFEKLENVLEFQEMSKKSTRILDELLDSFTKSNLDSNENEQTKDEKEVNVTIPELQIIPPIRNDEDPLHYNRFEEVIVKEEIKDSESSSNTAEIIEQNRINDLPMNVETNETTMFEEILAQDSTKTDRKEKFRFRCKQCEHSFAKKYQLKMHMSEVHEESFVKIECKFGCGKSFRRIKTADSHYRKHHTLPLNIDLKQEEQKDASIAESNQNENLQNEEKAQRLLLKIKINKKLEQLGHPVIGDNQIKLENPTNSDKTTCTICFKSFCSVSGLNVHMRIHLDERPFQCDQCNRGFNKRVLLLNHIAEIHTDSPLEIVCKYGCGKIFHRQHSAMNHYRLKHILPEKGLKPNSHPRVCEDCGKVCKNISILKEHRYQHIPLEDCPYQCEQCNKRFRSKKNLVEHLKRHLGIKNFECELCGAKKTTRRELRLHMNFHTKELQVACPICSKVFNSPQGMKKHEQVVHQGIKKYNCRFCELSFGKPDTLKHHEMRHTGEKPHKCKECEKSFIQLVALQAHMKTHRKASKLIEVPKITNLDVQQNDTGALIDVSKHFL